MPLVGVVLAVVAVAADAQFVATNRTARITPAFVEVIDRIRGKRYFVTEPACGERFIEWDHHQFPVLKASFWLAIGTAHSMPPSFPVVDQVSLQVHEIIGPKWPT